MGELDNQPLLGKRKMLRGSGANEDAVRITDSYDTDELDTAPANKKAAKEPD